MGKGNYLCSCPFLAFFSVRVRLKLIFRRLCIVRRREIWLK